MNLLFDLDGTLADPMLAFSGSMDFAFDTLGVARLSREKLASLIGPPLHLALPELLGAKAHLADEALRVFRQHHGETGIYDYAFYPGMDQALDQLKSKHRLFVATSKPKIYADRIFDHFGKSAYFEGIYGSELSGKNSKKGDVIRLALEERKLNPNQTIMIGDRKHDMIGAQETGTASIGVTWGYGSHEELQLAGANVISKNWDELVEVIARMEATLG